VNTQGCIKKRSRAWNWADGLGIGADWGICWGGGEYLRQAAAHSGQTRKKKAQGDKFFLFGGQKKGEGHRGFKRQNKKKGE